MITVAVGIACFSAGAMAMAMFVAGGRSDDQETIATLRADVEHYKTLYGIEAGQVDDLLRGSGFQ